MAASRIPPLWLCVPLALLLCVLACSTSEPAPKPATSPGWVEHTSETASFRIKVRIGPQVALEVMQPGAVMAMVDQGQAVNHHFEVHIFNRSSGAEIKTTIPGVTISQQATKLSRGLPNVDACLLANHRVTEPHFGDNLYLADGTYAIDIAVGNETTLFADIVVKAAN